MDQADLKPVSILIVDKTSTVDLNEDQCIGTCVDGCHSGCHCDDGCMD